jgi:hypothetical protein
MGVAQFGVQALRQQPGSIGLIERHGQAHFRAANAGSRPSAER